MGTNRKGWSIVELITVTIVIGILVSIGIPSYRASIEQSHCGTGIQNLRAIRQAEISYYAINQQYTNQLPLLGPLIGANLVALCPPPAAGDHWGYSITINSPTTFTLRAQRNGGRWNTTDITLDQNDLWGGSYPIDGPY